MSAPTAEARVRVRYAETDQMGVVYHANYVVWFEVGRVELLRSLGLPYKQLEEEGILIAVVEVNARYKRPARYDDEIAIRTTVKQVRGGSIIRIGYQVVRVCDEELLCEGETVHVVIDREFKKSRLPDHYAARMAGEMAGE
ncbi:acyl-CoA thioesterase [Terriglobus tenax]|uniref:acyl-CoA thioesterase n=1 Tax=Terriglobus tenax TaxID=1111115 RepID=UPI0021E0F7E8|nr:thioesterase family protein [Terriglobus tenax]